MKESVWIIVFAGAVILLMITAVKSKSARQWIGWILANMAVAALFLYILNVVEIIDGFTIPINTFTMITAALLGLPGVLALGAINAWVL